MKKKKYKKILIFLLSSLLLVGTLNGAQIVSAYSENIENVNLIENGEFTEKTDWAFQNGGYASNNGYPSGTQHFYLDGGTSNWMKQTIYIPADGQYKFTGWIASDASGTGGKIGVRMTDGTVVSEAEITTGATYTQYILEEIELKQGDTVEVYVSGSTKWINGDTFEFLCTRQDGEAVNNDSQYLFEGNMIVNPSFTTSEAWVFSSSGYASNNGHNGNGDRHFYINRSSGKISQEVQVPYTGYYKVGVWVASAGTGAKFGAFNSNTGEEQIAEIYTNTAYTEYVLDIWANKGDEIEVYVTGGSNWVNGDDISLEYDLSRFVNMVADPNLESENAWIQEDGSIIQSIYIPQDGPYYSEVTLENAEGAVVSFAGIESDAVTGSQTVRIETSDLKVSDLVELKITGNATITNAVVKFDLSKIKNEAPAVSDIMITGDCTGGLIVEGSYTYSDPDGHAEGNSVYQWFLSEEIDGDYTAIEGEVSKYLKVREEWEDQYLKFQVTPVDQYEKIGEPQLSEAIGPVDVNLITNPDFESDAAGWSNISISNKDAYSGLVRGIVRTSSIASQTITVQKTSYYDLTAYVRYSGVSKGMIAIQDAVGNEFGSVSVLPTNGEWEVVTINNIALEEGQSVKLVLEGATDITFDIDSVTLKRNREAEIPAFTNIKSLTTSPDTYKTEIDSINKTITLEYLYGTDLSKLIVEEINVSAGAEASIKAGDVLDLTNDVMVTVNGSDESKIQWTLVGKVREKKVFLESSNEYLEDNFNWAANKVDQFVMTGTEDGPINLPQSSGETADYIPSYWAGYYNRTAFYSRDFVHQATGAQIAGLSDENYSMFSAFAKECTEARKWYTVWALNFDGSIYTMDYYSDTNFVREIPAQFELVEKAYKQYLWSGDERYITDETLWAFYTNVMTNYVDAHDTNGNSVADEVGTGIFKGSSTYNERSGRRIIEAGDAIGSQYQATLAYANMLKARGEEAEAEKWYLKAADLKKYFNEEWSVADEMESEYVCALGPNGEKYSDFSKETSWFMPLKMITEAGERNDAYIDFILENLGDGIGTTSTSPSNIEAYTYIPDMLFLYNRSDEAWKWMKYITSIKDEPHENASQGTNGDYPEISFTLVSQTIEGMMGVEPDAGQNFVATSPRLPQEVPDATVKYMQIGDYELNLEHASNTESTLTNSADKAITWEARFYGEHQYILVDGQVLEAEQKTINGEVVSYVTTEVEAGESINAKVVSENDDLENPFTDVSEDAWYYNSVMYAYKNGLFYGTTDTTFEPNSPMTRGMLVQVLYRIDGRPEVSEDAPTFPDVNSAKYYANAISWAAEENLVSGYKDGTFGPEDNITREQIAKILYRYAEYKGYDVTASQSLDGYKDADQVAAYAVKYLEWATAEGLIKGDDGTLNPKGDATRAEISAILRRFIEKYE